MTRRHGDRGARHVGQLLALRFRARVGRSWDVFDPRDGRAVRRFFTEEGAASYAARHGLDYDRRGAGWIQTPPAVVTTRYTAQTPRRRVAGVAAVLMSFAGGYLTGAGTMAPAGAEQCPPGTVATYSLDRGDMSRCVSSDSVELLATGDGTRPARVPLIVRVTGNRVDGFTVTRVVDGAGVDTDTLAPGSCGDFRRPIDRAECRGAWQAQSRLLPEIRRALRYGMRPCISEDGPGPCAWRADLRGNGRGRSFVVTRDGSVSYFGTGVRR